MRDRLIESFWALLIAADIVLCTIWLVPLYVFGLAGKPTGRQLISSYVGEAQHNGMKWAKLSAWLINEGAELLGDGPDHCYRIFRKYQQLDD